MSASYVAARATLVAARATRLPAAVELDRYYANGRRLPHAGPRAEHYADWIAERAHPIAEHARVTGGVSSPFLDYPYAQSSSGGLGTARVLRPSNQRVGVASATVLRSPTRTRARPAVDAGRRAQLWVGSGGGGPIVPPTGFSFFRRVQRAGIIEEVTQDRFRATVSNFRPPLEIERVVFLVGQVSDDDLDLLRPGVTFYWLLGYMNHAGGPRTAASILHFRRVPSKWTADQLRWAQAQASETVKRLGMHREDR